MHDPYDTEKSAEVGQLVQDNGTLIALTGDEWTSASHNDYLIVDKCAC